MNAGGEEFFQAKGFIDAARHHFQAQRLGMIDFSPSQIELGQEGIERVAILNLGIPSTILGTDADFLNFLILQICQIGIRIQWPPWHFMYFRLIGVYGIINQYGLEMVGGPVGGLLSDKLFHSPTKYLRIGYLITAVVLIAFTWMPYQTFGIWAGIIVSLAISACVYSMRAVFFAPMDEVDVPREITGSAMSMASFIGYLPGAFMYAVYGSILDSHQGIDGYQIVFTVMTVFAILGVLLSTYITHRIKAAHTLAK